MADFVFVHQRNVHATTGFDPDFVLTHAEYHAGDVLGIGAAHANRELVFGTDFTAATRQDVMIGIHDHAALVQLHALVFAMCRMIARRLGLHEDWQAR
jgi:hypothetical protein